MKKTLITIIAAVAMLCGGSFSASAQMPDFNPEEMVKMIVDQMKESLKLTDEQVPKVMDLQKKQMENMQKMFEGGGFDFEAMQKQMDEHNAAMKKILTEEQFKKWEEQQAQMMQGGGF